MCKTPKIFTDSVNDIDNSIFDYEFLYFYYTRFTKELLKLIKWVNEFVFGGRDYTTATFWSIPLSESIRYTEKIQIDQLKREKLSLPPYYREQTIDLAC